MESSNKTEEVRAGCRTCGWSIVGSSGEVRQRWIDHTHDPIYDITERAVLSEGWVPVEDVLYLLDQIDLLKGAE